MNCGPHTQFHLPLDTPTQQWRGEITVAYTLDGFRLLRERLLEFLNTSLGSKVVITMEPNHIRVHGTWGRFLLRPSTPLEAPLGTLPTSREDTAYTRSLGLIGITDVTLHVGHGTILDIANFYQMVFGFEAICTEGENPQCIISGGPTVGSQTVRFQEMKDALPYNGDHFCIYITDFERVFERLMSRNMLYINERFLYLDNSHNLEEARYWQAFRIMHTPSFTEEHEVRSSRHKRLTLPAELAMSRESQVLA
jgi:hypothetical protein